MNAPWKLICLVLFIVLELVAASGVPSRVNLEAAGLAFLGLAMIL